MLINTYLLQSISFKNQIAVKQSLPVSKLVWAFLEEI